MELLKPKIKDYPGKHIEFKIDNPNLDFAEAKDIAKQKELIHYSSFDPLNLARIKSPLPFFLIQIFVFYRLQS